MFAKQAWIQAGFNDFLSKPVHREDLVNMILKFKRTGNK